MAETDLREQKLDLLSVKFKLIAVKNVVDSKRS